jgi:hypothetical protein
MSPGASIPLPPLFANGRNPSLNRRSTVGQGQAAGALNAAGGHGGGNSGRPSGALAEERAYRPLARRSPPRTTARLGGGMAVLPHAHVNGEGVGCQCAQDARPRPAWAIRTDGRAGFHLLRCLVHIWGQDERESGTGRLLPVIPTVVYHGRERWAVASGSGAWLGGPEALRIRWRIHCAYQHNNDLYPQH